MGRKPYSAPMLGLGFVAYLCLSMESSFALAQSAETLTGDTIPIVMIASRQYEDQTLRVIKAIEGQLSDLPVTLQVEWLEQTTIDVPTVVSTAEGIAEQTNAMAVIWCDLSRAEEVYLYLSDRGRRRILVRRLDAGEEGATYESLAVIVHSVVEAMLQGANIGMEIKPVPGALQKPKVVEKKAEPPKAEPKNAPFQFRVEAGWDISGRSPQCPVVQGLNLVLSILFAKGIYLFGSYIFRPPVEVNDRDISLDIKTYPALLGAGYAWRVNRLSLGGSMAFVAEVVSQKTRSAATETADSVDNRDFVASLFPMLTAEIEIDEHISLRLIFGCQIYLNGIRYVSSDSDDQRKVVDDPWRVIPHGILGLVFSI